MSGVHDPFLLALFPSEEKLIPTHATTKDEWVIGAEAQGNNTLFDTQWIQCSYQISGGYGHTPRYIYYGLIAFALWQRRKNWLAEAAMASIMVYSGSAAIHALILAAIREKMAPKSMIENYEIVRVQGISANGTAFYWDESLEEWTKSRLDNSLWLPVLPMVWDSDVDATLAIVGIAFLVLLPMQIWSTALRNYRVKIVIWLWSALLLVGMVSGLIAVQYVAFWSFPQLRFCPHGAHDNLPLMNDGTQTVGGDWDGYDWYHWNATIERQFMSGNSTHELSNICIYPCFDSSWPLRDNTDIMVVGGDFGPMSDTNTFFLLLILCYFLVASTGLSSLTIAILTSLPDGWTISWLRAPSSQLSNQLSNQSSNETSNQEALRLGLNQNGSKYRLMPEQLKLITAAWKDHSLPRTKRVLRLLLSTYFISIYFYTLFVSPFVVLFFVVFMEWAIWESDPGGETFHHVGQWNTIIALALVFVAAIITHYSPPPDESGNSEETVRLRQVSCGTQIP